MDPLQGQRGGSDEEARLQDQRQQRATDSRFQQMESHSPHLAFQDSNLSPAMLLLPSNSVLEHNTDYSLFQQTDMEFAPLRAYPDVSVAFEKFQIPPHEFTSQTLDQASLSQHPLEEAGSSSCSLSQHSLSPARVKTSDNPTPSLLAPIADEITSKVPAICNLEKVDDTYFLNKDVQAQQLMRILQKDVGMLSSSSSSKSSSKTSEIKELKSTDDLNPDLSLVREGPPGEASVFQQQPQTTTNLYINESKESKTRLSDVFNITVGSRSTKPDDSSEALRQEMLDLQRRSSHEASEEPKSNKTSKDLATPFPTKIPKLVKTSLSKENLSSASLPGPFSTGIQQRLREQDLWSSGNQTGIDGSYLGFLPQSQSTPGVFKIPPKSSAKSKFQQLSDIESTKESLIQTSAEVSTPTASAPNLEANNPSEKEPTCDKVQSLPSLTYMQKVDAWRANQSGKTSLFDSLALQGFTGISPKKKAYDAVSDSLNRILSQQVVKMNENVNQNPSVDVSATLSPRREEAAGSAPSDKDNIATQSASPFNRSQSHSSLSTVVMSVKKENPTEARIDKPDTEEAVVQQHPTTEGKLSPLVISLGQFSDVTLSNSQDSSNSGQKVATSVGTSSISLEVDNYDPYWTGKLSTPPPQYKLRELNIEERIPLYLQNLGIDQSPSTILTPFAPRGPIREPEFSPTELGTIKGSTPTKSIQPSESGTPHKAEFSRSSLQSVDSSFSFPPNTEAYGFGQDHFRRASSSSDTSAAAQFDTKLYRHPNEDIPSQQQRDSSQSPVSLGPSLDQEDDKNLESMGQGAQQNGEISLVSSGAFSDIRKLLSQAENLASPPLDRFPSQRKEALFTSAFSAEESKSQSSHLWTRSSSDSTLTTRERLTGGEHVPPTRQSGVVSRSAGLSLVLNKSVQRAEPEGCSAAPPDRVPQPQPQAQPQAQPPPQPPPPSPPIATTVPEENMEPVQDSPVHSSTSSPVPVESVSDRSSESSLAIRVAKLLHTESPATMVSSTTSVDQEEGRAREWIKQMISGQKCEPLELDQEDRRRIEEIKRELLLKNPKLGYASTDTESSAASSLRPLRGLTPVDQVLTHKPQILDSKHPSDLSKSLSTNIPEPCAPREDIEAKVREIAAKEGVNLPKTKALTSITISTCRRSTSPSPLTSPAPPRSPSSEPLHVKELTTEGCSNTQVSPPLAKDELSGNNEMDEITVESQILIEKSQLAARQDTLGGQYEDLSTSAMSLQQNNGNFEPVNKADIAGVIESSQAKQVTGKSGHVSQVRLTLSPKPAEHVVDGSSFFSRDVSFGQRHFVPLRHSPSIPSSPDEGVGLSSPPEWQEVPKRHQRYETNRGLTQQRVTSSVHVSPKPFAVDTTVVPHLLPYKPHGSEELFYVPQTEPDSSNDTTVESTHTGSDDALPPRFSSDVLGHKDPGLDRGVTIRHTEGIYSKRLTQSRFTMTERGQRDAVNKPAPITALQTPKPTSPVFTRALPADTEVPTMSRRDQGTSPVPFFIHEAPHAPNRERPYTERPDDSETYRDNLPLTSQQNVSGLDQLWQKFSDRWRDEESRTVREREATLLERLERLSRIIQSSRDSTISEVEFSNQELHTQQRSGKTGDLRAMRRQRQADKLEKIVHDRKSEMIWNSSQDLDSLKPGAAQERDVSDTWSSTSMSTVDTARLIRAFGADRVQRNLRSSSSLSKLYSAISKQRGQDEQARTPSETSVTEESSVVVDSGSSTSTYTLPLPRGPSKSLVSKKAVKQVSKGIQAGDLEIVSNGTRRHTRDVGTTFPSPSDRGLKLRSSSSSSLDREQKTHRSLLSKSQKHRKSHSSPPKRYPHAISWFISADELKAEARKENEPEQWRPSTVWFEPLSKQPPWREPLRQIQLEELRNVRQTEEDSTPGNKKPSSSSRVTLQDALRVGRPDFVSRSRQRQERLALQVEERRLQTLFNQEREELFIQPGGPGRLPRPAGAAHLRRAVPRKEMIQRSKQIYENLPEVRRRREDEQRKVEYRSYRLNAQLYNKRITNHVLGKRSAWS